MRARGFTLLELLVVTAIIVILAAILFPTYGKAKSAAKRTSGLSQLRQIGAATTMYLAQNDERLYPRRIDGLGGPSAPVDERINPDYQHIRHTYGQARADGWFGPQARNVLFFSQVLAPYTSGHQVWLSPGNPDAWARWDERGATTDPAYRGYGGQNSYGLNVYLFTEPVNGQLTGGLLFDAIAEPTNTILAADASYYSVLPRYAGRLKGYDGPFDPCVAPYTDYWKNLGNSYYARWQGGSPAPPADAEAMDLIEARYGRVLNVVRADGGAKAYPPGTFRYREPAFNRNLWEWDPYKKGETPCP